MSELLHTDSDYATWIKDISRQFKRCQIKAASRVNEEMLRFYWRLGYDIESIIERNNYGSKFYDNLSKDISRELPDIKSFSPRNLRYMADFYNL